MSEFLSLWPARGPLTAVPESLSVAQVKRQVAERRGVTVADLEGPSRLARHARARQQAYVLAYAQGRLSLPAIGERFGGRDHSTIRHGILAVAKRAGLSPPKPTPVELRCKTDANNELLSLCRTLTHQVAA